MANGKSDHSSPNLIVIFEDMEDPRVERGRLHSLQDIILLTLIAVIAGADNFVEVELFNEMNEEWLREFLTLENGIPSHDTFSRVFRMLDPVELGDRLLAWVDAVHEQKAGGHIAIDGKTLRRTFEKANGKAAMHVLNAWSTEARMCLGTVRVEDGDNEISTIPKLLKLLNLKRQVVTIDAIGCQKEIARAIKDKGGDYVLRLKDNQPTMSQEMTDFFTDAEADAFAHQKWHHCEKTDGDHGRVEVRTTWATEDLDWFQDKHLWPGLRTLVAQRRIRSIRGKDSETLCLFLSSLPAKRVQKLAQLARNHWAVENQLHWVLDVVFHEDASRTRKDHAPLNLAVIRRLALTLAKRHPKKCSMSAKRRIAGWDRPFLVQVLTGV